MVTPDYWLTLDGKVVNEKYRMNRPIKLRNVLEPAGHYAPFHGHNTGQLMMIQSGLIKVSARNIGYWVVPPGRAVWLPPHVEHDTFNIHKSHLHNVYFREDVTCQLPKICQVVTVTPLLKELISTFATFDSDYEESGSQGRLVDVLIDQVSLSPTAALHLPLPNSKPLINVVTRLQADLSNNQPIGYWAKEVNMSERTLARKFIEETGITFGQWRQQARLFEALTRLAQGESISNFAQDLGYQSQSAFINMFKKALGTTPAQYFANRI